MDAEKWIFHELETYQTLFGKTAEEVNSTQVGDDEARRAAIVSIASKQKNKMCAAQNPPATFNYTWGIADNIRTESVVEFSPNVNYTVSEASVSILQSFII